VPVTHAMQARSDSKFVFRGLVMTPLAGPLRFLAPATPTVSELAKPEGLGGEVPCELGMIVTTGE